MSGMNHGLFSITVVLCLVFAPVNGSAHILSPEDPDPFPVLRNPVDAELSPNGQHIVVLFRESSDLAIVDVATESFTNISHAAYGGEHPVRTAFVGDHAMIVNLYSPFVTEVDPTTASVVGQHAVPVYCTDILVDEASDRIYLANKWLDEVLVYDLAMNPIQTDPGIAVGRNPGPMAIGGDGRLYVGNQASWDVSVVNLTTGTVDASVLLGSAASSLTAFGNFILATNHGGLTMPTTFGSPMINSDQDDIVNQVTWINTANLTLEPTWLDVAPNYMDIQAVGNLVIWSGAGDGSVIIWRVGTPLSSVQHLDLLRDGSPLPGGRVGANPGGNRIWANTRAVVAVNDDVVYGVNYFRDTLARVEYDPDAGEYEIISEIAMNDAGVPITAFQPKSVNMTVRQSGERYLNSLTAWARGQRDFTCSTCHTDGHTDFRFIDDKSIDPYREAHQGPEHHPTIQASIFSAPYAWEGTLSDIGEFNALALDRHDLPPQGGPVFLDVAFQFLPPFELALMPEPNPNLQPNGDPQNPNAPERGRQLFEGPADCASCHNGIAFTDQSLHDVGTVRTLDTPHLLGLWDRAPFLHDGRAATLLDVLDASIYEPPGGGVEAHGQLAALSASDKQDLVAYMLSLSLPGGVVSVDGLPTEISGPAVSMAARPNPFADRVNLTYLVEGHPAATLRVIDSAGRLVRTFHGPTTGDARTTVSWDARDERGRLVPSGVYWIELTSGQHRGSIKVIRVR